MTNLAEIKPYNFVPDPKFSFFLDAAPDAIVVVNKDGLIVMVNQLTEKMFGYTQAELIGSKVESLMPKRFSYVHVKHRQEFFLAPKTRKMGEGRELAAKRKDGSEFSIEISLSPLVTENGNFVISIIRDITSRKRLEAKFQGLLESAPDGIVVIDTSGLIAIVNSQTEKLFDYTKSELIGKPIEILVPDEFKAGHVKSRDGYIANPHTRPMGAGRLLTGRKRDGTLFPVEISLSPLETEQGTLITSIVRDITDRRKAEDMIKASLLEKEALLKEIHHRVKNNLQVTSSLLRLQSDYIQDEYARELFAESQNRIRSMALVHEKLYQSSNLSQINFYDYCETLALLLFRSYGVNSNKIKFTMLGEHVTLSIENAVPCGLMINELISNCLKHAFTGRDAGEIKCSVEVIGEKIRISVADNGVGLPPLFDIEKTESLGLKLVKTLVRQINGELQFSTDHGVRFSISFIDGAVKK